MTTPRRYSRYDAVHLITTTLSQFQVDLERDPLHRRYPTTNFGFDVKSKHRDLSQALQSIDCAYEGLLEKLRSLGTVTEERGVQFFEAPNCNYRLGVEKTTDWNNAPMLHVGIYTR